MSNYYAGPKKSKRTGGYRTPKQKQASSNRRGRPAKRR